MSEEARFVSWFKESMEHEPYPFQVRFACESPLPQLVDVPTGMGKTAMACWGLLEMGIKSHHSKVGNPNDRV